jgi:hypothetical protein
MELAHSLPTGTILPGGAVFTMSSVLDFPTWLPPGKSKVHSRLSTCSVYTYILENNFPTMIFLLRLWVNVNCCLQEPRFLVAL